MIPRREKVTQKDDERDIEKKETELKQHQNNNQQKDLNAST